MNLEHFYKSKEEVFNYFRDYTKIVLYSKYKAKKIETSGKGLKILTPKQLFQILSITLAQVKAGNNSENLLNDIRQIVYFFVSIKRNH